VSGAAVIRVRQACLVPVGDAAVIHHATLRRGYPRKPALANIPDGLSQEPIATLKPSTAAIESACTDSRTQRSAALNTAAVAPCLVRRSEGDPSGLRLLDPAADPLLSAAVCIGNLEHLPNREPITVL
jgi:hypothetical protein